MSPTKEQIIEEKEGLENLLLNIHSELDGDNPDLDRIQNDIEEELDLDTEEDDSESD